MNADSAGDATETALHEVQLLDVPMNLYGRSVEYQEELRREFALIAGARPRDRSDVPARLLSLTAELQRQFGTFTSAPSAELQAALARGEESVSLTYRVPAAVGPAAAEFERLLTQADEFCRRGSLLTLATPDELVAFRRWFLGEFTAQIAGAPPRPWPAVAPG